MKNVVWTGTWVAERLGVELVGDERLSDLLGLALRRNPRRAHLLVSNVLGKHVPQSPSVVYGHGFALGRRVRELLGAGGGGPPRPPAGRRAAPPPRPRPRAPAGGRAPPP
ncbi:phosphoribosyltransferase domain-containing protein, partial [Streptomyces mirabilis]|uniref:phosphoribosyltransferase domain-containing protein n=1 Tax=Streptomyces mirabilis TaxID=68239 RepID=UPI003685B8AB